MWASRMPRPITAPMVTKPARTPFTVSSVRRALPPPSDGQLAEDGPRDVAEAGHHHAHRRRHPNELPLPLTAATTASATSSGVTASGAAPTPRVIFDFTNPGRTTSTCTP